MNVHTFAAARDAQQPFRELPSNLEAEQQLLGAILVNNLAYQAAAGTGIEPGDFYEPIHRQFFDAMRAGIKAGKKINPVTIRSFLSPDVLNMPVGAMTVAEYCARLAADATSIGNASEFARAIIFEAQRRAGLAASEIADSAAFHAADELSYLEKIRDARDRLDTIIRTLEGAESEVTFLDDIDLTLDVTDNALHGRGVTGIDPGIPEILSLTGPWQPGNLIFICGDSKQGKSAAAWQCFFEIAEKFPVAGNSGEMPRSQIIMREKARRTGISAQRQKLGRVSESDMQELVRAGAEMKRLKFIDIDCHRRTIDQLDARIGRMVAEHGIVAFFLDHLLKLAWTGKMENAQDHEKANRATSMLKDIAMKYGIVIVVLSHLNKTSGFQEPYGRTFQERLNNALRRRPTYKNFLGNIDRDADHAIITYQALPVISSMEPEEGTTDWELWREAMDKVTGRAEIILSLSREEVFPRRKEVQWNGATTSYGPPYSQAVNQRGLL